MDAETLVKPVGCIPGDDAPTGSFDPRQAVRMLRFDPADLDLIRAARTEGELAEAATKALRLSDQYGRSPVAMALPAITMHMSTERFAEGLMRARQALRGTHE